MNATEHCLPCSWRQTAIKRGAATPANLWAGCFVLIVPEHDRELVARTLAGDDRAFECLIAFCQAPLFNVALRFLGNREDARDVVQAAFIKAYTRLNTYDPRYRFSAWIHRIVMNEALNTLKRRRRYEELNDGLMAADHTHRLAEETLRTRRIQEALMRLPLHYRQVIVLRYFSELSHREIGEIAGVPEKTVKSRLFDARRILARELERLGMAAR